MDVTLLYFEGCPSWQLTRTRLREALDATGHADVRIACEEVHTPEQAERLGFAGSPTLLVDGCDPFQAAGTPTGLACRLYATPEGPSGSPTVVQLKAVLK